jgi:hypothetical protein
MYQKHPKRHKHAQPANIRNDPLKTVDVSRGYQPSDERAVHRLWVKVSERRKRANPLEAEHIQLQMQVSRSCQESGEVAVHQLWVDMPEGRKLSAKLLQRGSADEVGLKS